MEIKRIYIITLLLLSMILSSQDKADLYSRMYYRTNKPELKYSVMLNIVSLDDRGIIPLLEKILSEDIVANLHTKRTVHDESGFIELSKLVIKKLGDLKATNSASDIYEVYLNNRDPLLQAECLLSLGNMRAVDYIDEISYILHTKNQRPLVGAYTSFEIASESKVAFAAISALDRFRDIDGYSPVLFASIGWYNQRVRNYADKVLLTITENPIDALIPIIVNGDLDSKEKAITEVSECNAPASDKIIAAREALKQGHDNDAVTIQDKMILTSIRKKALYTTWSNRSNAPEDIPYLTKSLRKGVDLEESIYAIKALSINSSEGALEAIISALQEYNTRYVDGIRINYLEEDIIRELIDTLGDVGDKRAEIALTEVLFSGYPDGLVRKAKAALKKLS